MDSYNKVRYTDYLYMLRMLTGQSIFEADIIEKVFLPEHFSGPGQLKSDILKHKTSIDKALVPMEIKITKSKDAGRDEKTYLLFCVNNLRIYDNVGEYLADVQENKAISHRLTDDINKIINLGISIVSEDFIDDSQPQTNFSDLFTMQYDDIAPSTLLS